MLHGADRVLAVVGWAAAAFVVLMLFAGPLIVAEDKGNASAGAAPYGNKAGANGAAVFKANCGSCHTLRAAGTNGQVGPNLDGTSLSVSEIESTVRDGRGGMPAFGGQLSAGEISAVAAFVHGSR